MGGAAMEQNACSGDDALDLSVKSDIDLHPHSTGRTANSVIVSGSSASRLLLSVASTTSSSVIHSHDEGCSSHGDNSNCSWTRQLCPTAATSPSTVHSSTLLLTQSARPPSSTPALIDELLSSARHRRQSVSSTFAGGQPRTTSSASPLVKHSDHQSAHCAQTAPGSAPSSPHHQHLPTAVGDQSEDRTSYTERRRKNNEAARRSRDARRLKERDMAVRAATLEQENIQLRAELAVLRNQAAKLHSLLYSKLGISVTKS